VNVRIVVESGGQRVVDRDQTPVGLGERVVS
jgi:hypothetical protein